MKAGKTVRLIILALIVASAYFGGTWVMDNKYPYFGRTSHIYVYPTTTAEDVIETLIENGEPRWPSRLAPLFYDHDVASRLKPGHYVIEKGKPAVYAARVLNNGWQTPVRLTLSGTIRKKESLAGKISAQMMVDSASVCEALGNDTLLAGFGFNRQTAFAMFLPDTYEMYWDASVEKIIEKNLAAVNSFWTEDNLKKARKLKLDRMQVTILASIVDSETNCVSEMPLIAGVYLNRLKKGMLLQADPTIAFVYGYEPKRILKAMLNVNSPYNTYKYPGLPPGPICVPSKAALEASLNPDFGNGNLYFCASPAFDGTHRFASSYSVHCSNAKAFQRALDARNKK